VAVKNCNRSVSRHKSNADDTAQRAGVSTHDEQEPTTDASEKPKRRKRGTGRVWRIGPIWYVQYYNQSGRQIRETSRSTDERDAEKLLLRRLGQVAAGVHSEVRRLKYEDLRTGFFNNYRTNKRKSLRWKKNAETGNDEPRLDSVTRLDGFFAGYQATRIDYDAMVEFTKTLQAAGKADATINRSLAALRRMFHLAKESEKIRFIPKFPMLEEAAPRSGVLKEDAYPLLLAALPEYLRPVLAIGYHTGMRLGEVKGLRWEQVDFLNHIIRLNAGETKNDEAREIPVNDELHAMLETRYLKRTRTCPFVCHRNGQRIGDFRRVWYDRCSTLGLGHVEERPGHRRGKYHGLIFHDLRRTFVTGAEHAGAPRHEVMAVTGHKTEAVYKRYAIDNRVQRKAAVNRIVAYRNGESLGKIDAPETTARVAESHLTH
jgi:integrase